MHVESAVARALAEAGAETGGMAAWVVTNLVPIWCTTATAAVAVPWIALGESAEARPGASHRASEAVSTTRAAAERRVLVSCMKPLLSSKHASPSTTAHGQYSLRFLVTAPNSRSQLMTVVGN